MALPAKRANLDGLPDAIKAEYKPDATGGGFILDVEPVNGFVLENVDGLKQALGTTRTERDNYKAAIKAFEGLDANEARSAMQKVAEIGGWDKDTKVKEVIEANKRQMAVEHEKQLNGIKTENGTLMKQLEQHLVTAAATSALAAEKGSVALLLPHVSRQTRMRKTDDGRYIAEVIDENGNVRIGDAAGNPMTIPQLVASLKANAEFAPAFAGTGNAGSGASKGGDVGKSGAQNNGAAVKTVSRSDQAAMNANFEAIAAGTVSVTD